MTPLLMPEIRVIAIALIGMLD